ncbi:GntR family transcriptional regulator [Streptomyces sp. NPDC019531]|uniref:GntR family transcriptional regulator n=1 Tax=Streptomyces sp. NPDC019531 TaxID=3365062 RepID=UPI00384F8D83
MRARIADGEYREGAHLPPQRALAEEFDVSRDTIQRVLDELKSEGWIASRQGSGSRVIATPPIHVAPAPKTPPVRVALGPFVARAFARQVVELDVFTFTSESLDTQIRVHADAIRNEEILAPESIALRLLLPSDSTELPYPRARAMCQGGRRAGTGPNPAGTAPVDHPAAHVLPARRPAQPQDGRTGRPRGRTDP